MRSWPPARLPVDNNCLAELGARTVETSPLPTAVRHGRAGQDGRALTTGKSG